jgi:AraC family ethanolamine operon transcriptional activator
VNYQFQQTLLAEFTDVDQLCHEVRHWDLHFQPLSRLSGRQKIAQLVQGSAGHFEFAYARFWMNLDQRGAPPPGKFTFTIPGRSMNRLWWQGRDIEPGDIMVFFPGTELRSVSAEDFEVHLISLDPQDIAGYAERNGLPFPNFSRLPSVFKAPRALHAQAQSLIGRLETSRAPIDYCDMDALADALVRYWLTQTGIRVRRNGQNTSRSVVEEVLAAVSSGKMADLRISELCARAGISRRAVELAFQERFGVGPSAFLKSAQLAEARKLLQEGSPANCTVGDIMDQTGFSHVGQFATDYRNAFGERPSDTLRGI